MTSGIPFSEKEIDYVKQHSPHEFPSIIARGLAMQFREYNGGYRSTYQVSQLMKKLNDPLPALAQQSDEKNLPDLRKVPRKRKLKNIIPSSDI